MAATRVAVGTALGAAGGLAGWFLQETLLPHDVRQVTRADALFPVFVGATLGAALGATDGIAERNSRKILVGVLAGLISGVCLGSLGFAAANLLYSALGGNSERLQPGLAGFASQVLARAAGWGLFGLAVGSGTAVASRSLSRVRNGAIGGLVGGLIGGAVFDIVALSTGQVTQAPGVHETGGTSRLISIVAIGTLTGLLIAVVDELFKERWVRVMVGRNEGADILLSRPTSIIGRDERCDVPLFGDTQVGVQHAAIVLANGRCRIADAGTPTGTVLNGNRLDTRGESALKDGDTIEIGSHTLQFREKATQHARRAPESAPARPGTVSAGGDRCPYCGQVRDPSGACGCSIARPQAAAVGPAASARLTVMDTGSAGQAYNLTAQRVTIGRDPACGIPLIGDGTASRQHAEVVHADAGWRIIDAGSTNGVYVNGERVTQRDLVSGDMVTIGATRLRFELT